MFIPFQKNPNLQRRSGEKGWALLGLLLALMIMGIVMAASIKPNVSVQVQRSKEEEMIFRGEHMARGIARYYNPNANGLVNGIQLMRPPPYGYLTELKKLKEGITIGVREYKFVRASAMIDPMTSEEWEPVRARDPRIMTVLQAWAAETQQPIPQQYLLLAGPPQKLHLATPSGGDTPQTPPPSNTPPNGRPKTPQDPNDPDPDPNDDINDPLAHIFGSSGGPGTSNAPIVGVAPRRKGTALRTLYGLDKYEDWVFIYIPSANQAGPGQRLR
jgi:type II secretory pathway pseudopilin PulG